MDQSKGAVTPIDRYFHEIKEMLGKIMKEQKPSMLATSELFTDTVERGNSIYITGCSHSSIIAQETFYRAGGFLLMNPIFLPGMTLETFPPTRTSKYERISGIAEAVLSETKLCAGDTLVIVSISGRNTVPIEMAQWAKARGIKVVALTSVEYSENVDSRHNSGLRLFELADIVLDVMCERGDAVLEIDGLAEKTGPTSSVTGITIMHAVISQTLENLIRLGITPPVFLSANLDGADELNLQSLEKYKHQIHYM
ncbi:SIS domain-containing protein [Paenibacillus nasutitermitis]|uniref:SIS domain-containing protein n=1 Tax=Paenibacillus nasutitermitis TaxID=1652958 RepID=A0A916Z684_9BACL|nr:SIS domain-containing protein [Paenibacillus nasutitermitis]GGD77237.1 hypothetical protein GCM10010911_39070 [Paenibacillus nasutitermitis]